MNIADFLSPSDVVIDAACSDKDDVLRQLSDRVAVTLGVESDLILAALRNRELLGSTGTGGGVAIPHARVDFVQKPQGLVMKLKRPVDFESMDGKPVDLVFMVLLPLKSEGDPLGALASVSRTLRAAGTVKKMRDAATSAELSQIVLGQS